MGWVSYGMEEVQPITIIIEHRVIHNSNRESSQPLALQLK